MDNSKIIITIIIIYLIWYLNETEYLKERSYIRRRWIYKII